MLWSAVKDVDIEKLGCLWQMLGKIYFTPCDVLIIFVCVCIEEASRQLIFQK